MQTACDANLICLDFTNSDLLIFKDTRKEAQRGHATDTQCRPDITAAFDKHWEGKTTLWPCIRLAGANASKGKTPNQQREDAASYLHDLLLARPDLYVAQGLLTTKGNITLLFGIGGHGIRGITLSWDNKELSNLMYAFIYRLYMPDHFADSSYIEMNADLKTKQVTYTIRIEDGENQVDCRGFYAIYARNPFRTRTHVLSNPSSDVQVNGRELTDIKDQLCRADARFEEYDILNHIHDTESVAGVVEAVYHEVIEGGDQFLKLSARKKHRICLRQSGKPFMSIQTLQDMLEVIFDTLEGRFIMIIYYSTCS